MQISAVMQLLPELVACSTPETKHSQHYTALVTITSQLITSRVVKGEK